MKISEAARALDIPVSTIRFYERKKIIPKPLKSGASRVFTEADLKIISFVRKAQSVGFPLADIASLINTKSDASDHPVRVAELATRHRISVRQQIARLTEVDDILASMQDCSCRNFSECLRSQAVVEAKGF